jgi:hypothetical protein
VITGLEQYRGDTLASKAPEPDERGLAEASIARHARDEDDRLLLRDALFGETTKARVHGDKPTAAWTAAHRAWLDRCRTWMRAKGYEPFSTQISKERQAEYVAATGDVFKPPVPERAPVAAKPAPKPRGKPPAPSSLVPADEVRVHVEQLVAAGMPQLAIAEAAQVSLGAVNLLLRGRTGRKPQARIRYAAAQRILAVEYVVPTTVSEAA